MKIIKYKKLIICVMFILGIAFYFTVKHLTGNHADTAEIHALYNSGIHLKQEQTIDADMVIQSLKNQSELVTNSGEVSKVYTYSDSIFEKGGYIKDLFGERTLEMVVKGYFKTGYDLSNVTKGDIVVYGNTLFVKIPKDQMDLISLDIPFDEIQFNTKTGLFRKALSTEDKQVIYKEIKNLMTKEILVNESIKEKTYRSGIEAITNLLEKIPNCNKVVVQSKMY